ncbi:MAG: ubiquinone/menaquinone biosynthesis methyltransferase [Thermoplasmata archaeon]|nr:ubiquinone/menaquinone biosynthesis methyltransferase [Thermoplasmata archaeon]
MAAPARTPAQHTAPDGSPYPDRTTSSFEHDVRAMFTHIAHGYDWFDHVASLGQDLLWRPRALWALDRVRQGRPVHRVLDIGCGPGSLTVLAARHYPGAGVVGADFTAAMLREADARTRADPVRSRLRFARASALTLPFRDGVFDVAMSAFVVRNLPDLPTAFRELRRVLAPGGTLLTLEITEPAHPWVRTGFHTYFDTMVPFLGALVGSQGPYRYLPESLRHLPDRAGMLQRLGDAGFDPVLTVPQSLGIVTAYLATAAPGPAPGPAAVKPP